MLHRLPLARLRSAAIIFFLIIVCNYASQAQIISWNPVSTGAAGSNPWNPGTIASGVTSPSSGIVRGSSISNAGTASTYGGAGGFITGGGTSASDANSMYFTVTAACGTMSLSSIQGATRRSSSGPTTVSVYYALGGATTYTFIGTWNTSTTTGSVGTAGSSTLSGISALQNIAAGTTVKFIFTPQGSSGNWYFTGTNLSLSGSVVATSAPTIGTSPSASTITEGTGTTFTASSVTGATSYKWQRSTTGTGGSFVDITSSGMDGGGGTYTNFSSTSSAASNTLTLSNVPIGWNGYAYRCVAINCAGNTNSTAALLTVNPSCINPTAYAVTGGGHYCSGGTGVAIGLGNSESGVNYQLYRGSVPVGSAVPGSGGSGITFGSQTVAGTYSVSATRAVGGCSSNMTGGVTVTIDPLPSPTISGTTSIPSGGSAVLTFAGDDGDIVFYTDGTTPTSTTIGASGTTTVSVSPSTTTTYSVTSATSALGCSTPIAGQTATVTISSTPTAGISGSTDICVGSSTQLYFSGTAGGIVTYTDGSAPANVTLSGSSGIGTATVTVVPAGTTTYTLQSISSGGTFPLSGSATITVAAYPVVYNVTGTGSYCSGGSGLTLGVSNSETGVDYQLYDASGTVGSSVPGNTGSLVSFPGITTAGTYSVSATNSTGCTTIMNGSATVAVNPLPLAYSVTGTGSACAAVGVPVGLANSETGVDYRLYRGAILVGSPMPGNTGSPIAFGNQTTAGTYTVLATNTTTNCSRVMTGSAVVTITSAPALGAITGTTSVAVAATTQLSGTAGGGVWSSSGSSIATVGSSSGLVSGVYPGTTTITYVLTNSCGTATASTTVTVTGATPVVMLSQPSQLYTENFADITNWTNGFASGIGANRWASVATGTGGIPGATAITTASSSFSTGTSGGVQKGSANLVFLSTGSPDNTSSTAADFYVNFTGVIAGTISFDAAMVANSTGNRPGTLRLYYTTNGATWTELTGGDLPFAVYNNISASAAVSITLPAALNNSTARFRFYYHNGDDGTGSGSRPKISVDNLSVQSCVTPTAYAVTGGGTICSGDAGVAIGVANSQNGVNYQLYRGATPVGSAVAGSTGSPVSFTPQTTAGTYTVLATATAGGCAALMTGNVAVIVNPAPAPVSVTGGGAACGSTTLTATGGAPGTIYFQGTISNGTSTLTASTSEVISTTGTYFFRSRSTAGCWSTQGSAIATINTTPADVIATGSGTFCGGTTISASNGGDGTIYFQGTTSGGTSTLTPSSSEVVTASGTYYFRARSSAGCWGNEGGVTVIIGTPAAADAGPDQSICAGGTITMAGSLSGGAATGTWTTSSGSFDDINSMTAVYSPSITSGSVVLTLTTDDPTGPCPAAVSTLTVTINPIATASAGPNQAVCEGGIVALAGGTGGSATIGTWTASSGSFDDINSMTAVYSPSITSGSVVLTLTTDDPTGPCPAAISSMTVTVNPIATASAGPSQTVCAGSTVTLAGNTGGSATSGTWTASSGSFSNVNSMTAVYSPSITSGSVVLTLTTDDPTGPCPAAVSTMTVTVNPFATAAAGSNQTVCAGSTVTLAGSTSGSATTGTWTASSGSFDDINFMTAVYSPSITSGSVVLTLTTDDPTGPCPAAVSTMTVTVNPVATAAAGSNQTVCAGSVVTLAGSTGGSATTGTWTASSGSFDDINSMTAVYSPSITSGSVVLTLTTDDPIGPCPAAVSTMTVTVNPVATAAAGSNQTVCAGSTVTLAGSTGGSATIGTWSASSGSFDDINSMTAVYSPSITSGSVVLTLTTDDPTGPCPAAVRTMTVTVNPIATAAAGSSQTICAGSTVTLAGSTGGSATTGTWTASSGSFSNVNSMTAVYSPSITSGSVVLTLTTDDPTGPCPAAVSTMTVTVNPVATAVAGSNQTVCAGSTVTLAGSTGGSATTGTWTASSGSFSNVNSMTAVYSPSITSGSVVLTLTTDDPTGPCPAAVSTMTVTVNPVATAVAGSNQTVCAGSTVTLAGSTGGSATIGTWTASSGSFSNVNSMTAVYSPSITSGSVILTLTTDDPTGPCPAAVSTMTVTVNPIATTAAGSSQTICAGSTLTLAGSTGGSATIGTWTASSGSFSNVNSMTAVYSPSITSGSVVLTLTTDDPTGPCPAAVSTMTVTVNPIATAAAGSSQTICAGSTVTLAGSTGGSATIGTWTASSGSFSNVNSMTAVYSPSITSGSVVLTLSTDDPTGPCPAAVSTMTVTVNPVATAAAGSNQTVCAGSTVTLAGSTGGSATIGTWTASSGSFSNVNSMTAVYSPSITSGSVVLTLTTDDPTGPCSAAVSTMTVTVNPVATAVAGSNQTICAGSTVALAGSTGGSATTGTWTASSGSFSNVNSMTAVYSPSITSGSEVLTLTTDDPTGPCPAAVSTMTVTVNPVATAVAGSNQTVCAGSTVTLAGSTGGSATIGTWTASSGSFSNVNSMTAVYSPSITSGSVVLTLTTDDPTGPCPAAVSTMTVTVNPIATAAAGPNQTICSGNTVTLAGSISGSATSGTWTATSGSFSNVNSMTAVYTPSITSGSVVLTLTTNDPSGPCNAAVSTMTITVNPVATANAGPDQTACAGSTVTLAGNVGGSATSGTWTASSGSFDNINSMTAVYSPSIATGSVVLTLTTDDPTGPCSAALSTMTITVNPVATANAGPNQTVCAGSTVILGGSTGGSATGGTWSASSGSFSNVNSMAAVYSPSITSGSVVLTLTTNDPAGPCGAAVSTMTVTVNPAVVVTTGPNQPICAGGTLTLVGNISGGTSSGTWSAPSGTFSDVTSATATYTPSIAGGQVVLTLTTNDPAGPCPAAAATMTVTVQPLTIIGAGNVCVGSSIALSNVASGGTWSTAATAIATVSTTGVITGVAPGAASVIYSTGVGCSATATVTVLANPSAIAGVAAFCAGTTLQLSNATTGGTWSSSATGIAVVNASGLVSGVSGGMANISYHAGGCAASASINVDPVSPIIGNVGVCAGPITLSNAVAGGTWSSSNTAVATIDASGLVTGVSTGQTVVSYIPPVGCVATATVNVGTPSSITGQMTVCPGGTISLSNAASGGTWTSGNNATATVDAAGNVYGIVAGAVNITYTIGTGCFTVANVTVISGPGPITGGVTICAGTAVSLFNNVPGGTWSTSSSIATITTGGVLTGTTGGSAVVTYTLPTGCMATRTVTINATSPITGGSTVCVGQVTMLSSELGGGVWSSGNGSLAHISSAGAVAGVGAGNVTIYYIWPSGCQKTTVISVNPLMQSTGAATVCQGQIITLGNATPGTGIWSSDNTAIATVSSTGVLTGASAGTVAIFYITNLGCVATKTVSVNPAATLSGDMNVCLGQTTTLSAGIAGGAWVSNSSAMASVSASGVVTGNMAGQALIQYVLPTGCHATATVEVADLHPVAGVASMCAGTSAQLSNATTGGGTWSSSNTSVADIDMNTGLLLAGTSGTAVISFTSASGCIATKTITVNPAATVNAGSNQVVCAGNQVALSGSISGATSAQWSAPSGSFANANAVSTTYTPSAASGTVILTLTTTSGSGSCALATGTVAVTVNPVLVISGNTSICSGSTTLSSSVAGGTWSSSNSTVATIDASGVLTAGVVGNAVVSYESPNGCVKSVTVNIGSPAPISGNTSICTGTTVSLSNSVAGGTWRSSNVATAGVGVNTGIVSGINAGSANITYALNSVCYTVATVTVSAMPASVGGVSAICAGSAASLTNSVPGGVWSSSNTGIATVSATGSVTGITNGTAIITYATAPTCYQIKNVTINPSVPISGTPAVCVGQTTILSNSIPGGTWISGSSSYATVTAAGVVTGVVAGNVGIYYLLPTGCQRTTTVAVNALSQIVGASSACSNKTIALSNATPGGGAWSSTNTMVATVTASGLVTGIGAGSTTISFTAANGCATAKLITMNGAAPITGNFTVCVGQVTNVSTTATGGAWSTSDTRATVSASGVVGGVSTGSPRVSYIQTNGCQSVATVTVNPLSAITGGTQSMCQSGSMALSNATLGGGAWTSTNTTVATVSATGLVRGAGAGATSVQFTTSLGCIATRTVTVNACREADTSAVTSVSVQDRSDDVHLFPNPNQGTFTLKGSLASDQDQEVYVEVVNMLGQVIYRNAVQVQSGNLEQQIQLQGSFTNGMYLLNLRTTGGNKLFHFVLEQ